MNSNNNLKLTLNNKEYLLIFSRVRWDNIELLQDIQVIFEGQHLNLLIGEEVVIGLLEYFINALNRVIKKECFLPNGRCLTCGKSIGLCAVQSLVVCMFDQNGTLTDDIICSQQDYQLFSYRNKRASWIYNDIHENIILEITPWFDLRKCRNKIMYEKWIKNYKPILRRTIPPEIAQKWIQNIEVLLRTVRANNGLDPDYYFMANK